MRIAHFNTYPHGGAAVAARRICEQLALDGNDVSFFWSECDRETPTDPLFRQMPVTPRPKKSALRVWSRTVDRNRRHAVKAAYDGQIALRGKGNEVFSMAEQFRPALLDWRRVNADIVHLHWTAFMMDWPVFFSRIPDHVPIVWTLHDVNPFTGGCHYNGACERFQDGCGQCPQIRGGSAADVSQRTIAVKQAALRHKQIHVVSPAEWMQSLARRSVVWPDCTTFSVIHYGLPTNVFSPQEKFAARVGAGIGKDECVIGFGADDLGNPRKGFPQLLQALEKVKALAPELKLTGLLIGGGQETDSGIPGLDRVVRPGFLNQQEELARFYSACDMVAVPSLQDNQPQMALESMACGTPVIAFDAGGIGEFVLDGVTGRLVPVADSTALAEAIVHLATRADLRQVLGQRSRMLISREFEVGRQTAEYQRLYEKLLSTSLRRAS